MEILCGWIEPKQALRDEEKASNGPSSHNLIFFCWWWLHEQPRDRSTDLYITYNITLQIKRKRD